MAIIIHVIIALLSVIYATYVYFRPSQSRLALSYGLIGLTAMSGVYLVVAEPTQLVRACMSGVVYLSVVTVMTFVAQTRLLRLSA